MYPVLRRTGQIGALLIAGALLRPAFATLPLPTYPECGIDQRLDTCPPDLTRADGSWKGSTWEYVSFIPPDMKTRVRPEEESLGSGNGFDVAWRYSTGRFDVTVAVLDSGILWDRSEMANKVLLNAGELPLPRSSSGATCATHDCNGDGLFNVRDYAQDARVLVTAGVDRADGLLEPSDLIATFKDGVDNDGNGYRDDIAGWDFLWDDNDPFSTNGFDHGSGVLGDIGAEGGEADSGIGYCPNCSILPVRTGDSFIADSDRLAMGITYATDRGVKVIAMASGTVNYTSGLEDALEYAWRNGVLVVAAIGDELSYHHLYPGAANYLMAVHSIRNWPPTDYDKSISFLAYNGCNNYGTHLTLVAGTNACATGATGITAGSAGLVFSLGRDQGLELHPDEVRAMLVNSATDIYVEGSGGDRSPWFPSSPGWDVMFGYGRVNIGKALATFSVPPRVHLTSPVWFQYLDATTTSTIEVKASLGAPHAASYGWKLEWAPGGAAADTEFTELTSGSSTSPQEGVIFRWSVASIPQDRLDPARPLEQVTTDDDVLRRFGKVNVHTITLRLTATDSNGHTAEMRKAFFLHEDPDLRPGFPLYIGASGESAPLLVDVDGDGVLDILMGTASGTVHLIDGRTSSEHAGWPIQVPLTRYVDPAIAGSHAQAPAFASGGVTPMRQGVLSTTAVGDLEGDGLNEVVVSTMDGLTFVYSATGLLRRGFPVSREPVSDADTDEWNWFDPGFLSSPLLVDLDGEGTLEIVQAGMDQKIYAWRDDGSRLEGWPVVLEHEDSERHIKGRIVSSPVAVDMNDDGVLDLVIGSNEYDPELYFPGYAYAVSGLGYLDPDGPLIRGWPVAVPGALNGLVPFIAEGVTMSPIVADVDGDERPEVALIGTAACPNLYEHTGRRSVAYSCAAPGWNDAATDEGAAISYVSNPLFADVDLDGDLEIIAAMSGLNYILSLAASTWVNQQDHMIGVWDARTGEGMPGWPVVIEDLATFMRPAVADVDGDGYPEILATSGGYVAHAYDLNGIDVAGWPKFTGGFVTSAVAAGDVTGDGLNEVVMATHEGYLFVWGTEGRATAASSAPARVISPSRHASRARASSGLPARAPSATRAGHSLRHEPARSTRTASDRSSTSDRSSVAAPAPRRVDRTSLR